MSRRECPTVGAELLAAVSAALAVVKTHLSDPDPKVALRAVSELTKLLSVCARNGIELREGEALRPLHDQPTQGESGTPPLVEGRSVAQRPGGEIAEAKTPLPAGERALTAPTSPQRGEVKDTAPQSAGGGDDYAAQLNQPPAVAPAPKAPSLTLPARKVPATKPPLTSFLGRADPVSQPQRPAARPLALPD